MAMRVSMLALTLLARTAAVLRKGQPATNSTGTVRAKAATRAQVWCM